MTDSTDSDMQAVFEADVFYSDKKSIDVQKVVFKMWENRHRPDIVAKLAELLR